MRSPLQAAIDLQSMAAAGAAAKSSSSSTAAIGASRVTAAPLAVEGGGSRGSRSRSRSRGPPRGVPDCLCKKVVA